MSTSAAASAEIAKVAQTAVTTEELLSGDSNILDQLLLMFEKGLNQPIIYWQLASILGSLFLAWLLGKYIRMRIIKHLAANEIIESDEIKAEEGEAPVKPEHSSRSAPLPCDFSACFLRKPCRWNPLRG